MGNIKLYKGKFNTKLELLDASVAELYNSVEMKLKKRIS